MNDMFEQIYLDLIEQAAVKKAVSRPPCALAQFCWTWKDKTSLDGLKFLASGICAMFVRQRKAKTLAEFLKQKFKFNVSKTAKNKGKLQEFDKICVKMQKSPLQAAMKAGSGSVAQVAKISLKGESDKLKKQGYRPISEKDGIILWENADYKKNGWPEDVLTLARVIYSQTSTICSQEQIKLVCRVILNRVGNKAFGGLPDVYQVAMAPGQFSCVDSKDNSNWNEFSPKLNRQAQLDTFYAYWMLNGDLKRLRLGPDTQDLDKIVYYHDLSIETPKEWTNQYWKPVEVKRTKHFVFYKIQSNTVSQKEAAG